MQGIRLAGLFEAGGAGYYILVLAFMALLVALYIWGSNRREKQDRGAELQTRYKTLDRVKLDATPDEELVNAVAANLMGKLDARKPDAYRTIPLLSHGRCLVYSIWLICHELDEAGFEELMASPSGEFLELAADGLEELGAPQCAAALRSVPEATGEEALANLHADFLEAVKEETPLARCVEYIRDNSDSFVDAGEPSDEGDDPPPVGML